MHRKLLAVCLISSLVALGPPIGGAQAGTFSSAIYTSEIDIPYGTHVHQKLDVFYQTTYQSAPVIVLVHGGGWTMADTSL